MPANGFSGSSVPRLALCARRADARGPDSEMSTSTMEHCPTRFLAIHRITLASPKTSAISLFALSRPTCWTENGSFSSEPHVFLTFQGYVGRFHCIFFPSFILLRHPLCALISYTAIMSSLPLPTPPATSNQLSPAPTSGGSGQELSDRAKLMRSALLTLLQVSPLRDGGACRADNVDTPGHQLAH